MPYSTLLSPAKIGALELKNRIIMSPMGSNLAESDGHCGERIQAYYEARAAGGAGLVIMGVGSIAWPAGSCNPNQVAISDDCFLPGLKALTDRVHAVGGKAAIQLQHAGQIAVCDIAAGRPQWVPSIPKPKAGDMMAALTPEEASAFVKSYTKEGAKVEYRVVTPADIQCLIQQFADAADRAKRAGFDGVEIHAGHGYIISSFLSPNTNQRTDAYGGSLGNRARLLVEVIAAVKARVGDAFPVWCRLDAHEYRIEKGIRINDAVAAAQLAQQAGADAIHVSAYADSSVGVAFTEAPLVHQKEGFVAFAQAVKDAVNVPVIAVGRIEPGRANQLIEGGIFDFVAMGRKLLADPELPNKLAANQVADIRPCIYCYTCVSQIFINQPLHCAVNPRTGHEAERVITPAPQPGKVLVVGGGPAGLEAARVAAMRGHAVTLVERGQRLGGTVFFSSIVYPPNGKLIANQMHQVQQLNIDVRLNTEVTPEWVDAFKPDAVIVATGALRDAPAIRGGNRTHVLDGDQLRQLMTGEDARVAKAKLRGFQRFMMWLGSVFGLTRTADRVHRYSRIWMPVKRQVAIIGGGLVGLELAEFLAERGRDVVVLEEGVSFGPELAVVRRWRILHELKAAGVMLVKHAEVKSIEPDHVIYSTGGDVPQTVSADTVIIARGAREDHSLAKRLSATGVRVIEAGDGHQLGYIDGAVRSGFDAGLTV
ncbi:MAG TPA: FAD-dependent oxidoreductase [Pseudomonadales bacterium]